MLNTIYRGRRDRCHGWYNALTAVLLKAVYGKMVKGPIRDKADALIRIAVLGRNS
jgi:hypothetical protein